MSIRVEFYGIPRARAGCSVVELPAEGTTSLVDVLAALHHACPPFAAACLDGDRLRPEYVASLDGKTFAREDFDISPGSALLILSTDAGG